MPSREPRFGDLKPEERKRYIEQLLARIKHQREMDERAAKAAEAPTA